MRYITIDRAAPTTKSTRTLEVITAGLPRCATSSLQAALESDVFDLAPCMHMAEISPYPSRLRLTLDAMYEPDVVKRQKLLRKLSGGYAATADFPATLFIADLMDMYPDAAIVLNQRKDAKFWAQSMRQIIRFFGKWGYLLVCGLWTTDRLIWRASQVETVYRQQFGEGDQYTEIFYSKYNEYVKTETKKRGRDILEWQPGDGWKPLCEFLGRPIPDDKRKFPHLNEAADISSLERILIIRGLISWAVLGAAFWAAWIYESGLLIRVVSVV